MMGGRRRNVGWGLIAGLLFIAGLLALLASPPVGVGDVDPARLPVGVISVAAAVWFTLLAARGQRWQETSIDAVTERLASIAREAEEDGAGAPSLCSTPQRNEGVIGWLRTKVDIRITRKEGKSPPLG